MFVWKNTDGKYLIIELTTREGHFGQTITIVSSTDDLNKATVISLPSGFVKRKQLTACKVEVTKTVKLINEPKKPEQVTPNQKDDRYFKVGDHLEMRTEPGSDEYFYWGEVEESDYHRLKRDIDNGEKYLYRKIEPRNVRD